MANLPDNALSNFINEFDIIWILKLFITHLSNFPYN